MMLAPAELSCLLTNTSTGYGSWQLCSQDTSDGSCLGHNPALALRRSEGSAGTSAKLMFLREWKFVRGEALHLQGKIRVA